MPVPPAGTERETSFTTSQGTSSTSSMASMVKAKLPELVTVTVTWFGVRSPVRKLREYPGALRAIWGTPTVSVYFTREVLIGIALCAKKMLP